MKNLKEDLKNISLSSKGANKKQSAAQKKSKAPSCGDETEKRERESSLTQNSKTKGEGQTGETEEKTLGDGQKGGNQIKTSYTKTEATQIASEEDTLITSKEATKKSLPSLLLLHGPEDMIGQLWALKKIVTSVGRSSRLNDIIILSKSLSKAHFQIIREKGLFYLVDLKSTNKTFLDDKKIEPYKRFALKNNSYIKASHLIFKFLEKGNIEAFSSRQMLKKAQTDPLTGAGNRELIKVKGPEYFLSSQKLSFIVFDVDNFKAINDTFGHSAGDYVLKSLSALAQAVIRPGDLFIRYGGDEFCILAPHPLSMAQNITHRIKKKLRANSFIFKEQKISVNISIGITEKSPLDKSWEDIYHRADKISYQKKQKKKSAQGAGEQNHSQD